MRFLSPGFASTKRGGVRVTESLRLVPRLIRVNIYGTALPYPLAANLNNIGGGPYPSFAQSPDYCVVKNLSELIEGTERSSFNTPPSSLVDSRLHESYPHRFSPPITHGRPSLTPGAHTKI